MNYKNIIYIYINRSIHICIYTNITDSDNEHLNISLTCLVSYLFWELLPSKNGALEEANQVFLKRTTSLKNNGSFSLFVFLVNLYGVNHGLDPSMVPFVCSALRKC